MRLILAIHYDNLNQYMGTDVYEANVPIDSILNFISTGKAMFNRNPALSRGDNRILFNDGTSVEVQYSETFDIKAESEIINLN